MWFRSLISLFTSVPLIYFQYRSAYNFPVPLWFVHFSLSKIRIHRVNWRWYGNILMCMHLWVVFTKRQSNSYIMVCSFHPFSVLYTNQPGRKDFCLKYTVHLETHLSCRHIQKLMNITFCISLLQRQCFHPSLSIYICSYY